MEDVLRELTEEEIESVSGGGSHFTFHVTINNDEPNQGIQIAFIDHQSLIFGN